MNQLRRILVLSSPFPSCAVRNHGVFVKERVRAVANLPNHEVRVVSPVPYFPPVRWFKRWYLWSQFPRDETLAGLRVTRPRYFLPPKVGGYFESNLMYRAVCREVDRIRRRFDFDLIDAHWVYPNGVVAAWLGRRYRKPVVMTGRGIDILHSPSNPLVGPAIRRAMKAGTQFIGLSQEIAEAFAANGASRDAISVIPNGVDCDKFRPLSRCDARRRLNLPEERSIVLSVGSREERKGFHFLVDAIPAIRERIPNVLLAIVGGPPGCGRDHTATIKSRIRANGVQEHVRLAGQCSHETLAEWYSAANVFALISSREGSPNVVLEALACGTPCVATPVGGISEELADSRLGILLRERTEKAAAAGIVNALSSEWDRAHIRQRMESRSWDATAAAVDAVFDRALNSTNASSRTC